MADEPAAVEETTTGMGPLVAQVAAMVRAYYEGLGEAMPTSLKDHLTREFAAEINRAMGARIAGKG